MAIQVIIADDDILIREGLKIILDLDDEFEVKACAENGLQALEECKKNNIDVALLDVQMPTMDGVEATKQIVENTETKVLILTTFDDDEFIKQAIMN
ncbi:MAG: response regulator transcription factor, partial [Methanobacterium paludis]|nr:response regulator transcription factor [Methanobacterium paludis]